MCHLIGEISDITFKDTSRSCFSHAVILLLLLFSSACILSPILCFSISSFTYFLPIGSWPILLISSSLLSTAFGVFSRTGLLEMNSFRLFVSQKIFFLLQTWLIVLLGKVLLIFQNLYLLFCWKAGWSIWEICAFLKGQEREWMGRKGKLGRKMGNREWREGKVWSGWGRWINWLINKNKINRSQLLFYVTYYFSLETSVSFLYPVYLGF